jgi:16S rRNA processing protein RimM
VKPPTDASDADATLTELAVSELVAPHGLRGEVKGLVLTDFPEDLDRLEEVTVNRPVRRVLKVQGIRPHGNALLFKFEGLDSIEDAESLRGALVLIPRKAARPLAEGHFYVSDIVGLEVVTEDGRSLGQVVEVLRTGSNDVYQTPLALVPATKEAVLSIDLPARKMTVNPNLVVED